MTRNAIERTSAGGPEGREGGGLAGLCREKRHMYWKGNRLRGDGQSKAGRTRRQGNRQDEGAGRPWVG